MYWLKACPRCRGDLRRVRDTGDTYIACLQCGRTLTVAQERALLELARSGQPNGSPRRHEGLVA